LKPVLIKTHAIAFIEFITEEDGQRRREGPRGEVEEMKINEEWKVNLFRDPSNARVPIISCRRNATGKLPNSAPNLKRRYPDMNHTLTG